MVLLSFPFPDSYAHFPRSIGDLTHGITWNSSAPLPNWRAKIVELRKLAEGRPRHGYRRRGGAAADPRRHSGGRYLCKTDTVGRRSRWRVIRAVRISWTMRSGFLKISRRFAGDRNYGEDQAVVAGLARFSGPRGSPSSARKKATTHRAGWKQQFRPWPCRKATARRFASLNWPINSIFPVLSFCDTSGAYPGVFGGRARPGPKPLPARSRRVFRSGRPLFATIIGEAMSGRRPSPSRAASRVLYAGAFDLFGDLA